MDKVTVIKLGTIKDRGMFREKKAERTHLEPNTGGWLNQSTRQYQCQEEPGWQERLWEEEAVLSQRCTGVFSRPVVVGCCTGEVP